MPRVTSGRGGERFGDGGCDVKSGSMKQIVEGHGIVSKLRCFVFIIVDSLYSFMKAKYTYVSGIEGSLGHMRTRPCTLPILPGILSFFPAPIIRKEKHGDS